MGKPIYAEYGVILVDLDGTVYHGPRAIPGAADIVHEVRDSGVGVQFVTNNAAKAPADVVSGLRAMGVEATQAEVRTSAQAAASVLSSVLPHGAEVLVVGTRSLADEVQSAGLRPTVELSEETAAVVQGHSPETGWRDLAEACLAIRGGALWVACNVDATLPTERGLLPGNGSMVAALRTATGLTPTIAGKPESPLFETAVEASGTSDALVVGDRLDTDIAGAVTTGLDSVAVLSGVANAADLVAAAPGQRPHYIAADLSGLREPRTDLEVGERAQWSVQVDSSTLLVYNRRPSNAMSLLRAVCASAWRTSCTDIRAGDEYTETMLTELGLSQ